MKFWRSGNAKYLAIVRGVLRVALLVSLEACQVSIRSPDVLLKNRMPRDGLSSSISGEEVVDAYFTRVIKLPGFTFSLAGSYISSGDEPDMQKSAALETRSLHYFGVEKKLSMTLTSSFSGEDLDTSGSIFEALSHTARSAGGWPGKVHVEVRCVEAHAKTSRYRLALVRGERARLGFDVRCDESKGSLLKAVVVALHEAVHATLDLAKRQPDDEILAEWLALGAEGCLLARLSGSADGVQIGVPYIEELWYSSRMPDKPRSMSEACAMFVEYFRGLGARD